MFIGRTDELEKLAHFYRTDMQSAALVYGRRRVGKSELLKRFLQGYETAALYYECKRTSEMNNVESLAALVAEKYHYPPLAFTGMEALLDFLFQKAQEDKTLLVLDEYTYLQDSVQGLDSILQSLLDKYAGKSRMKLILCGSFVDAMKSLLLSQNPLYGRIDLTLHVKPMDYYESAKFYPEFSLEDKVRLYSVFGGVPYYNRLIDGSCSVRENIIALIASTGARLENEIALYLSAELSKFVNANEVFEALSRGFSRYGDILSQSHVSSSPALNDVLNKLMLMELVQKETPINEPLNRKRAGYFIRDNMSSFYYRYIFRFASQMRIMEPNAFYDRYIADDFEQQYVPKRFEDICRQYLIRQNRCGALEEPFDAIGKYSYDLPEAHKNGEFDIVTHDACGYVFYEAKFRKSPVTQAVVEAEIRQVRATGLDCYRYGFFSRAGFDGAARADVVLYDLKDLYA